MRRSIILATVVALGAGAAFAASPAIKERKAILDGWSKALKPVGPMLRGEAAYDPAPVMAALKLIGEKAADMPKLFPDDSKTGDDTKALPEIWANKAKFEGIWAQLASDVKTAQGAIKDEASFKANMGKVLGNCGACHKEFRGK